MRLMAGSIKIGEIDDFSPMLNEAAESLKQTGKEMWYINELSKEALLENNAPNERFIGLSESEIAGTMIM